MAKTILLVEDSPEAVELSKGAFSECGSGAELVVAYDGEDALEWLFGTGRHEGRRPESRPDIVFLDLKLPKINGFEVLERIRSDVRTSLVPVVMLTVSRHKSDIEAAYRLGANSFLVKPIDYDRYAEIVERACHYWLRLNESAYH